MPTPSARQTSPAPPAGAPAPLYAPTGLAMIRAPLLPVAPLQALFARSAITPRASADPAALGTAIQEATTATHMALREVAADPLVQEALLVSSDDLFQALRYWEDDPTSKKGRRAAISLLRYFTRMSTRATPFGLTAGVAPGVVGPAMDVRLGPRSAYRTRTRPDLQWLLYQVRRLENRPAVAAQLPFTPNPAMLQAGDRLYIPYLYGHGQNEPEQMVSLRATPVVLRALALAREGWPLATLAAQLLRERPQARPEQVAGLLADLRRQSALLSTLRPPLTGADPLAYVLRQIVGLTDCADIRDQLVAVQQQAAAYDAVPPGAGLSALRQLQQAAALEDANIPTTIAVDVGLACPANQVAVSVAEDLAQAAAVLLRISRQGPQYPHLAAYREAFEERYGIGREVPVLELLDEELGLGPPADYTHPLRKTPWPPQEPAAPPARDRTLLELAAQATRTGAQEVVLDEAILRRLQTTEAWHTPAPASLEIYTSVAAASAEAIAQGNYQVIPHLLAWPAGISFGRFLPLLGSDTQAQVRGVMQTEEAAAPDRLFAELVYLPGQGHVGNVAQRPALRRYEVVVDAAPGVPPADTLPLDDLLVGVSGDRFYLRSRARGAEVVIRVTHAVNPQLAPNACRFLIEVSGEGARLPVPFDWGVADHLPFLPRVRQGRIVFQPATWHPPLTLADAANRELDPAAWYARVQAWRQLWAVPRYVYLTDYDNRLLLDLENPLCLADFQEEWRRAAQAGDVLTLLEMLPGFDAGWAAGPDGYYQVELVVPLVRQTAEPPPPSAPRPMPPPARAARLRLPGSDWLYAKLYLGTAQQEAFLAGPLRTFLADLPQTTDIQQWFFIRYADPDPHIRLRLQGAPDVLLGAVLPRLTAWSQDLLAAEGLRKLALDTYDREIERYGGLAGLALAEAIFAADSQAVVDLLNLGPGRALPLTLGDMTLTGVDDLLRSLGLAWPERSALYQAIRAAQEPGFPDLPAPLQQTFHSYRKTAQRLVGDRAWRRAQPQGAALAAILAERAARLAPLGAHLHELAASDRLLVPLSDFLASCVHMHCNRLLGTDRAREFTAMYHLERTLATFTHYRPADLDL